MDRARVIRGVLAVALLAMLAAAGYMALRYTTERHMLLYGYRSGNWLAVQAEQQLLRLDTAVARYRARGDAAARDAVGLQLDLFWSRIPLILDSKEGAGLRRLPGVTAQLREIRRALPDLEAEVARLGRAGEPAALAAIDAHLQSFAGPLSRLTRTAILQNAELYNRKHLTGLLWEIGLVLAGLLLLGAALIALLWRQVRATERHAAVNARLSAAVGGASDGIAMTDAEGRFTYMNRAHARMFGYGSPETLIGRGWRTLYPAAEAERIARQALPQVGERGTWRGEALGSARDAATVEQELTLTRLAGGGVLCVTRDIGARKAMEGELRRHAETQRRQAEWLAELQEQNAELLAAVEAADIGVMICDVGERETPIRRVNEAFTRLTGYTHAEVCGRDPRLLQGPGSAPEAIAEMRRAVQTGGRVQVTLLNYRKDGSSFWNDMIIVPMLGADGAVRAWVGVAIDASESVKAERERKDLAGQFYQAQKMEAIGRLAGGVAHDLNNVLAIMSGFGSLLVDDLDGPARGYAERIVDAGERGKGVVQRLLDFARRDTADRRERTDLGTLLERTGGLMRAAVPQTAELVLQKAAQPVLVEANASLVEQALINLCVNARDALPSAAGSITVSVEAVELDGRRAEALRAAGLDADGVRVEGDDTGGKLWRGLLRAGPFARVSVRDDGAGMSAQTLRRIFDPMFTTKAPGKGTGLGMSTIAQMAYAHGGAIAVDSRVGVGTEVAVYLPLAEARAATAPAAIPFHAQIDPRPAAVSEPAASECILLVDDEPDLLACTRTQLERAGLRVLVADGAESAMDLHASHAGEIAAVVTDYAMPGRSGVDLARALHASDPDLAVVVCTGVVEDLDPDAAEAAGVDAVLRKPLRFDELFDLLGFDKAA